MLGVGIKILFYRGVSVMKAVIYENYGPPEVLKIKDIEKPKPKNNEILVEVRASSVSAGVLWVRNGKHPDSKIFTFMVRLMCGLKKPNNPILGYEFSGEVESTGKNVKLFSKGDKVFGTTTGLKQGSYAEYVCIPEKWSQGIVAIMPNSLSNEEAAAVPIGGITALQILRKANIQINQKVLIYGASGSVGTYAIQIAKYYKAVVTGVSSTTNLDLLKSLGADNVIDYTQEDVFNIAERYDVIFDTVGKITRTMCQKILKKNGSYLTVKSVTNEKQEYLTFLKELIESNKIKPVIDKIYDIENIVDAHKYVDKGHKKGNVIIKVSGELKEYLKDQEMLHTRGR
jgi:NADPH:quinone reductase-like Zn-dependent oxidoreductase